MSTPRCARGPDASATTTGRSSRGLDLDDPARRDHRHRRRQRLRQVDAAARARAAARPRAGQVLLDGRGDPRRCRTREVARRLGLLPQSPGRARGLTVDDLVARGRYPHQGLFRQWSSARRARRSRRRSPRPAIDRAARPRRSTSSPAASASARGSRWRSPRRPSSCCSTSRRRTSTSPTRSRCSTCSTELVAERGRTVVMVLHDLNQACRYADQLVAHPRRARARRRARPPTIVDAAFIQRGLRPRRAVVEDPVTGTPLCLPISQPRRNRCTS